MRLGGSWPRVGVERLALSPGCVTLEGGIWETELILIQECLWSFQGADDGGL